MSYNSKSFINKKFYNSFCYNYYNEHIIKIANDKNGCCFLQKCIIKLNGEPLNNILVSIFNKANELVVDQYGNYVIQYVLKKLKDQENNIFDLSKIFKFMVDNLIIYSNQKFCSNVIEKLFNIEELRIIIINKLLEPDTMKALFKLYHKLL